MEKDIKSAIPEILASYDPANPHIIADQLRNFWLGFDPKSIGGIKAEERAKQETVGIPVPVLKAIGKEIAKFAKKDVAKFLPLAKLLWNDYGREGRVVAVIPLGEMELVEPGKLLPILYELCQTCHTWEDADQLSIAALEPIIKKDPETWLDRIVPWLSDDNKWVRRAAVTAVGRLTMKHAHYTEQCLSLVEILLADQEEVVRKATSFSIRICSRGEVKKVVEFVSAQVPPKDPAATWVLCDVIRSMTTRFLPEFAAVLPNYQQWVTDSSLSAKDLRSIQSAIKRLASVD
jgi:3-methyladenine DNA glycosylase AlkD